MLVLGIESSCDDTSVALLDCSKQGCFVIKELTASQIEIHKKYGGVVPEIAGRLHAEKIVPLIESVFASPTGSATPDKVITKPDVIAVTVGPGLITGLIVGVEAARTLSYAWNIPLVAVNHIEGHIHSVEIPNSKFQIPNCRFAAGNKSQITKSQNCLIPNTLYLIPKIQYPALALVVSGGHTELIHIKKQGKYKIIGQTRDDAAGECFDKVAKLLDLPYPGGPQISKLAETGKTNAIDFPRPMLRDNNFDFSFAGLKTSALYWLRDHVIARNEATKQSQATQKNNEIASAHDLAMTTNDFCASFEQAIVDVLVAKTIHAAQKLKPKTVILAGGVSANKKLRATLGNVITDQLPNTLYLTPNTPYSMDNASMIAVAGYYRALNKKFIKWQNIEADPNLTI